MKLTRLQIKLKLPRKRLTRSLRSSLRQKPKLRRRLVLRRRRLKRH